MQIKIRWDEAAAIRPIGAVLADQRKEWAIARNYISNSSTAEHGEPRDTNYQPQVES